MRAVKTFYMYPKGRGRDPFLCKCARAHSTSVQSYERTHASHARREPETDWSFTGYLITFLNIV